VEAALPRATFFRRAQCRGEKGMPPAMPAAFSFIPRMPEEVPEGGAG